MIQSTSNTSSAITRSCQRVHAEDLLRHDLVAVSHQAIQVGTYAWCSLETHLHAPDEPVEIVFRTGDFQLLRVRSVALPFVLCSDEDGKPEVLDVRNVQLVRVPRPFAKAYRQLLHEYRKSAGKKKRKSGKRSKRK